MEYEQVMTKLGVASDRIGASALNARWFLRNEAIKHRKSPFYLDALQLCQKVLENEKSI
jgi:hypothetical protein